MDTINSLGDAILNSGEILNKIPLIGGALRAELKVFQDLKKMTLSQDPYMRAAQYLASAVGVQTPNPDWIIDLLKKGEAGDRKAIDQIETLKDQFTEKVLQLKTAAKETDDADVVRSQTTTRTTFGPGSTFG